MKFPIASLLLALAATATTVDAFTPNPPSSGKIDNKTLESADLKAASIENIDLNSLSQLFRSKIDAAQSGSGDDSEPLSEEAKDDIIATAVAGSVVGTVVGSPLLIGAALGYAGSQMLTGERGEKARGAIGKASKDLLHQANAALAFTQEQLENEKDLSSASKKILLAIQDRAQEVKNEFSSEKVMESLQTNFQKTVESEEFKMLPNRTFQAVRNFIESDEVKKASSGAMHAIQAGLESDEMKALKSRASQAVQDTIRKSTTKN